MFRSTGLSALQFTLYLNAGRQVCSKFKFAKVIVMKSWQNRLLQRDIHAGCWPTFKTRYHTVLMRLVRVEGRSGGGICHIIISLFVLEICLKHTSDLFTSDQQTHKFLHICKYNDNYFYISEMGNVSLQEILYFTTQYHPIQG